MNVYPYVPGAKTGGTSTESAKATKLVAPRLRDLVLRAIEVHGPMTADECADALGKTEFAVRPRLSELRKMDKLEDSSLRRVNASGHRAVVWRRTVCQAQLL